MNSIEMGKKFNDMMAKAEAYSYSCKGVWEFACGDEEFKLLGLFTAMMAMCKRENLSILLGCYDAYKEKHGEESASKAMAFCVFALGEASDNMALMPSKGGFRA